jgi:hypothetical protein
VPDSAGNGSRAGGALPPRRTAWAAVAVVCGACLDGNAEPIVRLPEAGTADAAATPDAAAILCDTAGPIVLYYRDASPAPSVDQIDFLFKVANATGAPISLNTLAIRYYFTNDLTVPGQTAIYYTGTCCGDTRTNFNADVLVSVNPIAPTSGADTYLEVTFDSAAGVVQNGDSVQVEVGFHATGYTQNLNQTNDYSYSASASGTQAQWDACPPQCAIFQSCRMTVYRDGILVWGQPP